MTQRETEEGEEEQIKLSPELDALLETQEEKTRVVRFIARINSALKDRPRADYSDTLNRLAIEGIQEKQPRDSIALAAIRGIGDGVKLLFTTEGQTRKTERGRDPRKPKSGRRKPKHSSKTEEGVFD